MTLLVTDYCDELLGIPELGLYLKVSTPMLRDFMGSLRNCNFGTSIYFDGNGLILTLDGILVKQGEDSTLIGYDDVFVSDIGGELVEADGEQFVAYDCDLKFDPNSNKGLSWSSTLIPQDNHTLSFAKFTEDELKHIASAADALHNDEDWSFDASNGISFCLKSCTNVFSLQTLKVLTIKDNRFSSLNQMVAILH